MKSAIFILLLLPSLSLAGTLQKGLEQKQKGDCPAAVRTLESYAEDHPESFQVWEALAQCWYEMGIAGNAINMNAHDKSRRAAIRAFRLDQSKKDMLYIVGMTSLSVDDQAMAIGSYELLIAAGENDQAGILKKAMSAYEPPQMDGGNRVAISKHSGGVRTVTATGSASLTDYEIRSKADTWDKTVGRDYDKAADSLGRFGFLSKAERESKVEMEKAKADAKAAYLNSLTGNQQETPETTAQGDIARIQKESEAKKKLKRDLAITRSNMERDKDRLEDEKRQVEHDLRQAEIKKQQLEREKRQMQNEMDRARQQQQLQKFRLP